MKLENNLEALIAQAKSAYSAQFDCEPVVCAYAPARVNLIGEHVDYNGGPVLPMAVPLYTVVLGGPIESENAKFCNIHSLSMQPNNYIATIEHTLPIVMGAPAWSNYVRGVMHYFKGQFPAFNAVIASDVPLGAGLSSSAALETAMYNFLEAVATHAENVTPKEKALLCQKAEHTFANVPCGIMDQFVITMAEENNALLIDCRSFQCVSIPFNDPDVVVLVTDSGVKHELCGGEYAERRATCEKAAKIFGKNTLRELTQQELTEGESKLDTTTRRRATHVISEIDRTFKAAELLKCGQYNMFGKLMVASHKSLRDDFEVSCVELDELVEAACGCSGVYGSRMTGGGFGGCTVTLVQRDAVAKVIESIKILNDEEELA